MPHYVETSDSSAAQTRALAAALAGRHFDPFGLTFTARNALKLVDVFPRDLIFAAVNFTASSMGISFKRADRISIEKAARWITRRYPAGRRFPAVLLGAPNGGVSHIGSILGAPFLTTHFLYCFRHVKNVDDIRAFFRRGRPAASIMARNNPLAHAVCHYDPIHDRPPLAFVTHVRLKLLSLPEHYADFIGDALPNGNEPLILINCRYSWLQYSISPRVSFQVGGLGGVADGEFIDGSSRIDEYLYYRGSPVRGGWRLPSRYSPAPAPESEWGLMPQFAEAAKKFAARAGRRLIILSADHPENFSELAFLLHKEASEKDGVKPLFIFADCFNQLDPHANLRSRLLPLWLPYYDERSFDYAKRMLERTTPDTRVLFTMHPSYSDPFDMVPLGKWLRLFRREQPPILFGVDPQRFPYDISYVYRFGTDIRNWSRLHTDPVRSRLTPADLVRLAPEAGIEVEDFER